MKELVRESKDVSELIVDLAYAAVFFGDDDLAREVLRLEDVMDNTVHELRILSMLAARSPEDAEALAGVVGMVNAMEEIADAAEDIARVVLKDLGVPGEVRDDLRHAEEVLARVKVRDQSPLSGQSLREASLPSETGMWVIAIRRDVGVEYVWGPSGDTVLAEGDVLFLQGPAEGVDLVRELAGGEPHGLEPPKQVGRLSNLDRAVDLLIELKNSAEVAVGLAYSAILFNERGLAREVSALEDRCDDLFHDLQRWVLRAASDLDDDELDELRGLLQIGSSSERIADAAQEMTRVVEADEEVHPVISVALQETDEVVADALVGDASRAEGRSLRDLSFETETGMYILAIQRERRWVYRPRAQQVLLSGDRVLATGPVEGIALLRELVGDDRPIDSEEGA